MSWLCTCIVPPAGSVEHVIAQSTHDNEDVPMSVREKVQSKARFADGAGDASKGEGKSLTGLKLTFSQVNDVQTIVVEDEETEENTSELAGMASRSATVRHRKMATEEHDARMSARVSAVATASQSSQGAKKRQNASLLSQLNPFHGLRNSKSVEEFAEDAETRWVIMELLGEGGFGKVFKVQKKGAEGDADVYAMKDIPCENVKDLERFEDELNISKQLQHPNIVRLYETIRQEKQYFLIMDLCTGGDFFDLIISRQGIKGKEAAIYIKMMLSGLAYMHHYMFVHRDIKPENYMVQHEEQGAPTLKLIDFGLARQVKDGELMKSQVGTRNFMAPEIWATTSEGKPAGYDRSVDIWGIGVTTFAMVAVFFPWTAKSDAAFIKVVKARPVEFKGKAWLGQPKALKDIIERMLLKDYTSRPTAKQIVLEVDETQVATWSSLVG